MRLCSFGSLHGPSEALMKTLSSSLLCLKGPGSRDRRWQAAFGTTTARQAIPHLTPGVSSRGLAAHQRCHASAQLRSPLRRGQTRTRREIWAPCRNWVYPKCRRARVRQRHRRRRGSKDFPKAKNHPDPASWSAALRVQLSSPLHLNDNICLLFIMLFFFPSVVCLSKKKIIAFQSLGVWLFEIPSL